MNRCMFLVSSVFAHGFHRFSNRTRQDGLLARRAGRWAYSSPTMHARDWLSCVLSCAAEFRWLWAAAQRPSLSGAHGEGLRTRHVPAAGTQTTANLCAAPRRQTVPSLTYHTPNSTVPHISHEHSV